MPSPPTEGHTAVPRSRPALNDRRAQRMTRGRHRWRLAAAAAAFIVMPVAIGGLAVTTAAPAVAEANGVGATPAMGWSSWSFIRHDPTAADIEAQAAAMASSLDIANAAT